MNTRTAVRILAGAGILVILGACAAPVPLSMRTAGPLAEGQARIVVVTSSRGVEADLLIDGQASSRKVLRPGGSVVFDVSPGRHRLSAASGGPANLPGPFDPPVPVKADETVYLNLVSVGAMPSSSIPGLSTGDGTPSFQVRFNLVTVTRKEAEKIAAF